MIKTWRQLIDMRFFQKKLIFFCILLGLIVHWIPNFGIPLHSDTTWIFRLQNTSNFEIIRNIPEGFKEFSAYPTNFLESYSQWYKTTGRFNIGDFASLRLLALLAGKNADIWRLTYVLIMSSNIYLLFKISQSLKISSFISVLGSLVLFLSPLDVWTDYRTAEPRALFFFLVAILLTLKGKNSVYAILSALSICISVLNKENFIVFWILIPVFYTYKKIRTNYTVPRQLKKETLVFLLPHFICLFMLLIYFICLKLLLKQSNSGYLLAPSDILPVGDFMIRYFKSLTQTTYSAYLLLWVLCAFYAAKRKLIRFTSGEKVVIMTIFATFALHGIIHFLGSRFINDHYIMPANFLYVLLVGLLFSPLYKLILKKNYNFQKYIFIFAMLIFIYTLHKTVLPYQAQNRVDQSSWQQLITDITINSPKDANISLRFADPYMIEMAFSLEADTLLSGRSDLRYRVDFADTTAFKKDNGYLKYQEYLFNKGVSITDHPMIIVEADRKGGKVISNPPVLMPNPFQYFVYRYYEGKSPYLNYAISYE